MKNQSTMKELNEKDLRTIDGGSVPAIVQKMSVAISIAIAKWLSR